MTGEGKCIGAKTPDTIYTCTGSPVGGYFIGPTYNYVAFNPLQNTHYSINVPCNGFNISVLVAEQQKGRSLENPIGRNVMRALGDVNISPGTINSQSTQATKCFDLSTPSTITCSSTQNFCLVIIIYKKNENFIVINIF